MSRAVTVELRQAVAAPASVAWDAVVDWPTQQQWMLGTTVAVTSGDGRSVGSTLSAYSGRRPFGFVDTMTITGWDPPRCCVVSHTGKVVRGKGIFTVQPAGAGASTFRWREELVLPLGVLGALGWPVARPAFVAGVRYSLRRFAAVCADRARG